MRTGIVIGLALLAAILGACNGGGQMAGGGTGMVAVRGQVTLSTPAATGVQTLAGVSAGAETIVINGKTYDISNAQYTGDRPIQKGMVVTVVATNNTSGRRRATSVFYMGELKARVVSAPVIDPATVTGSFTALGHVVYWDERTEGREPSTLNAGECVEISGFSMGDERIHATYVAQAEDCDLAVSVVGIVTTPEPLVLNGILEVNKPTGYSETLAHSDVVKVTGSFGGTTLNATSIEKRPGIGEIDLNTDEAEVEGFISGYQAASVGAPASFFVAGQPVKLGASPKFSGGTDLDLADGVLVEVEGPLVRDANGAYHIRADEVEFEDGIEVEARVTGVSGDVIEFFDGAISIRIVDATERAPRYNGLSAGDCADIRARAKGGELIATRVEEDKCDNEVELQGPAQEVDANNQSFKMFGMPIDTSRAELEFEDDDEWISRERFFSLLGNGDIVSLEGRIVSGSIIWDEVEIER